MKEGVIGFWKVVAAMNEEDGRGRRRGRGMRRGGGHGDEVI